MSITLAAQPRTPSTKSQIKALRNSGSIPATVYGRSIEAVSVSVSADAIRVLFQRGERFRLLRLEIEGGATIERAFIKEIVRDSVRREIVHIDFHAVGEGESILYRVPLATVGVPEGVKVDGGSLQLVRRDLKVRVAPEALVDKVEYDVSNLKKGDAFFVKDLSWTGGTIVTPARQALAVVS